MADKEQSNWTKGAEPEVEEATQSGEHDTGARPSGTQHGAGSPSDAQAPSENPADAPKVGSGEG